MSQKAENLLNLALDATEEERVRSLELEVGYDPIDREWDLVIKYSGSLEAVRAIATSVAEMANEYAVITIAESRISALAQLPTVDFIEKPKRLFFQMENGKRVSCINEVQRNSFRFNRNYGNIADESGENLRRVDELTNRTGAGAVSTDDLYGSGVLIAVIDSGIDYTLPDFRYPDGTTRIRALWDQTLPGNPPTGYAIGTEYTAEQINEALAAGSREERERIVPSCDVSGHGTAVAGIAAGSGSVKERDQNGDSAEQLREHMGVAPGSEFLIVKLGSPRAEGFPRTTELMQGVDYVVKKALEYRMPVAINLSFGNTYGSHEPYN